MRFVYLDFFRFAFALLVALLHFQGAVFFEKSYLAVDFFFILSGFVLTHAYLTKAQRPNFLFLFFIDRVARLYPLYLLTLAALAILNIAFYASKGIGLESGWSYQDGYFYTFVVNILMLQGSGLTTGPSWNAPAWSISVEILTNIGLAFVILRMADKERGKNTAMVAGFLSLLCYMLLFNTVHTLGNFTTNIFGVLNAGLVRGIAGISLGVMCYATYQGTLPVATAARKQVLACTILCGVALACAIIYGQRIKNIDFAVIPIIFIFVLGLAHVESAREGSHNVAYNLAERLGAISYAVYVIHWPLIVLFKWQIIYAMDVKIDMTSPAAMVIFVLSTCILSFIAHHYFELPMKSWLRKWLTDRLSQ